MLPSKYAKHGTLRHVTCRDVSNRGFYVLSWKKFELKRKKKISCLYVCKKKLETRKSILTKVLAILETMNFYSWIFFTNMFEIMSEPYWT